MKLEDTIFEYLCEEADNAGLDILDEGVIKAINDKAHFLAGEAKKAGKSFKAGYDYSRLAGKKEPSWDEGDSNNTPKKVTATGNTSLAVKAGSTVGKVVNKVEKNMDETILAMRYAKENGLEPEFKKWKATGETKLAQFKSWLKSKRNPIIKESYFNY
jgi:hypothetical protein